MATVLMGLSEYAKHRGISLASLKQMIEEGRLEGAVKIYANGKGNNPRKKIFWEKADGLLSGKEMPQDVKHEPESGNPTLVKARTAKTAIEAKVAQLKYEELAGNLVRVEEVQSIAKEMGRVTRESILTLPDRLAPILAGETEINEIHRILTEELNTALRNLALRNFDFFKELPSGPS